MSEITMQLRWVVNDDQVECIIDASGHNYSIAMKRATLESRDGLDNLKQLEERVLHQIRQLRPPIWPVVHTAKEYHDALMRGERAEFRPTAAS